QVPDVVGGEIFEHARYLVRSEVVTDTHAVGTRIADEEPARHAALDLDRVLDVADIALHGPVAAAVRPGDRCVRLVRGRLAVAHVRGKVADQIAPHEVR